MKDPEKSARIELQLSQSSKHKELAIIQRIAVSSNPNAMPSAAGQLEDGSHHHLASNIPFVVPQSNNTGFSTPTSLFFGGAVQNSAIAPSTTEVDPVTPTVSPQPQFSYNDLNTSSINGLSDHVHVSPQVTHFVADPACVI